MPCTKIITLEEMGLHEHLFSFFSVKTDVESINPNVLFHAGHAVGCRREAQDGSRLQLFSLAEPCVIAGTGRRLCRENGRRASDQVT